MTELPENEVLHVFHSLGRESAVMVREGDEIVFYLPDRKTVMRRFPYSSMDERDRAYYLASWRVLRNAADAEKARERR